MPELLLVVGNVVLWGLGVVGALVVVLFTLTAGRYEWRPNQSRRKPQPTMGRPPRGGSNVQPPRKVRCAEYEALGGTPLYRDGKIVGYEWQSTPNAEGLVQTGRLVKLEDA